MKNGEDIAVRHLRALSLLVDVQSLTKVADLLNTTQPAISKMLQRLRVHFGDPLFVRVGLSMHPTPKALSLAGPLKELLRISEELLHATPAFDPKHSKREFKVLVTEVGMILNVPPLMQELELAGPGLRLRALPLDTRSFVARLENGEADVAIGAFPQVVGNVRRQRLYVDHYVSVVRANHPKLDLLTKREAFLNERHIVVTASSTGHAVHQQLEQILSGYLLADQIRMRVPSFVTCAYVASRTDTVGSLPARLADHLARDLKLEIFRTPLPLPRIEIAQFWHERVHQDAGHRWFRSRIAALYRRHRMPGRSADEAVE
jgi:DNA-binding transcriptional LysR family regulator